MFAFLDFEASSLSDESYPIEVGWVFADGTGEAHLIRPAPQWTEWDTDAEAIHHISRAEIMASGTPHDVVARHMVEALGNHTIYVSAPSWDGKWLSALLRAAGFPRKMLQLNRTDDLLAETAQAILSPAVAPESLARAIDNVLTLAAIRSETGPPKHRALADAEGERQRWIAVQEAARIEVLAWS